VDADYGIAVWHTHAHLEVVADAWAALLEVERCTVVVGEGEHRQPLTDPDVSPETT
jgi:hypothetical protein